MIFFLPQLTSVHTSSELAAPVPSSHWKTEHFSCYFSWAFFLSFVKSLAENHSSVVFPLSELWRCPVNPGIVLVARDSGTSQMGRPLLQLT